MNFKKRVNGSWTDTSHYIHNTSTDTLTTLPAVLYPNDTTATVGLKGNTVQSGTPTPDSPIIPQGTGERTGNLYGGTDISGTINNWYYKNDFVYANIAQGTYTLAFDLTTTYPSSKVYVSSLGVGETGYSKDIKQQSGKTDGHFVFTFTIEAEDAGKNLYARFIRFDTAVTITYTASNIMLNSGSTALPYENFGYKIPISSAGQTTPIYLGEVETTRKIKKLVLTGSENLTFSSSDANRTVCQLTNLGCASALCLCTHIKGKLSYGSNEYNRILTYTDLNGVLYISIEKWLVGSSLETFKAYLAAQYANGTPVTVWYVLATPETGIVNEPLMKIGDYADTVPGITIPTITGRDIFDVLTALKPSEVSLNYTGWHDAEVKEYVSAGTTIANLESMSISQMENLTIQELQGGNWV